MKLRSRMLTIGVLFSAIFISAQAGADPELLLKWIEKHIEKKKVKTPW